MLLPRVGRNIVGSRIPIWCRCTHPHCRWRIAPDWQYSPHCIWCILPYQCRSHSWFRKWCRTDLDGWIGTIEVVSGWAGVTGGAVRATLAIGYAVEASIRGGEVVVGVAADAEVRGLAGGTGGGTGHAQSSYYRIVGRASCAEGGSGAGGAVWGAGVADIALEGETRGAVGAGGPIGANCAVRDAVEARGAGEIVGGEARGAGRAIWAVAAGGGAGEAGGTWEVVGIDAGWACVGCCAGAG